MASPNQPENETRFAYWFRWTVVSVLMPALSFVMILLGVCMTGIFASSIQHPGLSQMWQWLSVMLASGAFFVGILSAQDWQRQRVRFREQRNSRS